MFADAYEIASGFTRPVIVSLRYSDKSVESSLGSYVILNEEGWIITAAHIINSFWRYKNHQKEPVENNNDPKASQPNPDLPEEDKQKKKRIINHSFWWGADNVKVEKIHVNFDIDLAIGKLSNLPGDAVKKYPKLINHQDIRVGTSLCKLGFPFYNKQATWNSKANGFELDLKASAIPRFPMEGMYTRNVIMGKSRDKKYERKFIETSTPGLRGQSGGPIFDTKGRVWAIQSQTISLPLGFSPKLKKGDKETTEHQFINVGLGVHPEIIVQFLNEWGVKFEI